MRKVHVGLVIAAAGALVGAGVLFATLGGPDPATPPLPPPNALPEGAFLGVHTKVEGREPAPQVAATEELEAALGRTLDIDHVFYPWDEAFPTAVEQADIDAGRIPMISWNGKDVYTSDIAAGKFDDLIIERAEAVKELGATVMIRWFWEMDGAKKAEWAQGPESYVAAWRHIVDTFSERGADNVAWVWCPNASAIEDGDGQAFYPGDLYVDWICGDGYNWAPGRPGDRWRSFTEIFGGFYKWAAKQDKPIMVGEFGVQERAGGDKAAWLDDVRKVVPKRFPLVKAIVYFNANHDYDWRITTSPASLAAFKRLANDPWFVNPPEEVRVP